VTGVRQDAYAQAHPLIVEQEKVGDERGKYLSLVEHGMPEAMGIYASHRAEMRMPKQLKRPEQSAHPAPLQPEPPKLTSPKVPPQPSTPQATPKTAAPQHTAVLGQTK